MAELKFDHNKETIVEAMGLDDSFTIEHSEKCAKLSTKIIVDDVKGSQLVEEIMNTFSYNDLLYATTYYIINSTKQALESNPMMAMMAMFASKKEE